MCVGTPDGNFEIILDVQETEREGSDSHGCCGEEAI